jgi:hypothetical protein
MKALAFLVASCLWVFSASQIELAKKLKERGHLICIITDSCQVIANRAIWKACFNSFF